MGTVNDVAGTIGGVIMVFELIVLLVLLIGVNAVLLIGLRWVRRKRSWISTKRATGQSLVDRYVDRAANAAAAPVIIVGSVWSGLKAGLHRATHWERLPAGTVHSAPQLTEGEAARHIVRPSGPSQAA